LRTRGRGTRAIIAYTEKGYAYLVDILKSNRLRDFFEPLHPTAVQRFELPGIRAVNFLLHDVLQGGASQSLRTDNQGKVLALALLEMEIPVPENLSEMTRG
jgi:hypothetical protein